jgi:ABC-type uncharacterized transport system involved in gliding motility auxiliary subunit
MKRVGDWVSYAGLVLLALAVVATLRPQWWPESLDRFRAAFFVGGIVLVLASFLFRARDLRGTLGHRSTRYGFNSAVMILLVLGVIGFVEALSYRHNARLDLTENRRHSLSPQTIQLLGNLKTDVTGIGFFRSDQPGKRVAEDLFKQYARYSKGKFSSKIVDPDREPGLARRYGIESYGTVILETKTRSEKVLDAEEEKLTNGLVKLTREGKRVVYVLQGHGEHDIASTEQAGFSEAKGAVEKSNYEVKPIVLAQQEKVPDDAAVVIVPGPRTDVLGPEIAALDSYVARGGKLLVMLDSTFTGKVREAALRKNLMEKYGVEAGDNLVIEVNPVARLFGATADMPIVQQYEPHPITRDMRGVMTIFPLSRTVGPVKTPPTGVSVQPLVKTSAQSWAETNRAALEKGQINPDPEDPKGPVPLAAVATKEKARIVVYGTSELATNQFLNFQGNRDFFLNTVSWLAEEEDQIAVRPKDTKQTPIFLSAQQAQAAFLLPVVILPAIPIVGGIIAVVRRRSAK